MINAPKEVQVPISEQASSNIEKIRFDVKRRWSQAKDYSKGFIRVQALQRVSKQSKSTDNLQKPNRSIDSILLENHTPHYLTPNMVKSSIKRLIPHIHPKN